MRKAKHEQFRLGGFVSLWLGRFDSELELDDHLSLSKGFADDFGFEIYAPDGPEAGVSEEGPKQIRELLRGFSRSQTFVEAAASESSAQGWAEATTAVVFYNFKYDPRFINPDGSGQLTFICSLRYSGFS